VTERDNATFSGGERWSIEGALTIDSAARVFATSRDASLPSSGMVGLDRVHVVDSAAVALLLAWKRRAADEGKALRFTGIPLNLAALAALYGVEELLASDGADQRAVAA
jgi:phospholipid transport system transporter-binding protein